MMTIEVIHPKFGMLVNKSFDDDIQMKLFVNMFHVSLVKKESFDYYDGKCDMIHIPYKVLNKSIIVTNESKRTLSEYFMMNQKKIQNIVDNVT
jgi:hypothetical protein